MSANCRFNMFPALREGETVLLFKKWVWLLTAKSLPSYRVFFSLPPLWEAGLYITNQRVLLVANVFRLLTQEVSLWYTGQAPADGDDQVTRLELGHSSLLGPFLEVISTSTEKHWFRSADAKLRLYMREAEVAHQLLAGFLGKSSAKHPPTPDH